MKVIVKTIYLLVSMTFSACSNKDSLNYSADKDSTNYAEKTISNMDNPASQRKDSLLIEPIYIMQILDSLQNKGIAGTDTLKLSMSAFCEPITFWYESDTENELKMCPDIKRVFLAANRLQAFYIYNYLDLLKRIEKNLSSDRKKLYEEKLAIDISFFINDVAIQTCNINPQVIKKTTTFCPTSYSTEKEELFSKGGNEKEIMSAALIYGANPIVEVYDHLKKAETTMVSDMHGLNRKYLDVF